MKKTTCGAMGVCLLLAVPVAWGDSNADLRQAVDNGDVAAVDRALAAGADIHHRDAQGKTVLMLAAEKGNIPLTQALFHRGADTLERDTQGHHAAWYSRVKPLSQLMEDERLVHTTHAALIDIARLRVTPEVFKTNATKAFQARGWELTPAGAGVVAGRIIEDTGREVRAEMRYQPPHIILSFVKGYGRKENAWLMNLAKDFLGETKKKGNSGQ